MQDFKVYGKMEGTGL